MTNKTMNQEEMDAVVKATYNLFEHGDEYKFLDEVHTKTNDRDGVKDNKTWNKIDMFIYGIMKSYTIRPIGLLSKYFAYLREDEKPESYDEFIRELTEIDKSKKIEGMGNKVYLAGKTVGHTLDVLVGGGIILAIAASFLK